MTHDTLRGQILAAARAATEGDRNQAYGDPKVQLALAGALKGLVRNNHEVRGKRVISNAEWEAIDMCLTKISRIILGPKVTQDNYTDLAAYAAIAGECALDIVEMVDASGA